MCPGLSQGAGYNKRHVAATAPQSAQEEHEAWQRRATEEEVLEPELPVVDCHHHFWYKVEAWAWTANYMLEELCRDINGSGHNVVATVNMYSGWKCADGPEEFRVVGETELMQGMAVLGESGLYSRARVCAGIVGTADLLLGAAVEPLLRAHMALARNFRGVRYLGGKAEMIKFDDVQLRIAVGVLQELGLVLDCNGPETHPLDFDGVLGGLADLASAFPNLTVVVDHCGGAVGPRCFEAPEKRAEWERNVKRLAACSNTVMKVGGLQMRVNGFPLGMDCRSEPMVSAQLAELLFPYYAFVIKEFGAERCMFESNYPPDRWGTTYKTLWNAFKIIAKKMGLSDKEKAAIFHDTAVRVYHLQLPSSA